IWGRPAVGRQRRLHHMSWTVRRQCHQERGSRGGRLRIQQNEPAHPGRPARIRHRGLTAMRRLVPLFLLAGLAQLAFGQSEKFNHAHWILTLPQSTAAPGATVLGRLDATVDRDWHMYSFTTPPGPIPTSIEAKDSPAIEKFTIFEPPPIRNFDPNFNGNTETYEGAQTFYVRVQLKKGLAAGPVTLTFVPRYQTCSGTSCIPPRTRTVTATLNVAPGAAAAALN